MFGIHKKVKYYGTSDIPKTPVVITRRDDDDKKKRHKFSYRLKNPMKYKRKKGYKGMGGRRSFFDLF